MYPAFRVLLRRRGLGFFSTAVPPPLSPFCRAPDHPTYLVWSAKTIRGKPLISTGIAASFLLGQFTSAGNSSKLIYLKPVVTGFVPDFDSSFVYSTLTSLFSYHEIFLSTSHLILRGDNVEVSHSNMVTGAPELLCNMVYALEHKTWEEKSTLKLMLRNSLIKEMDLTEEMECRSKKFSILCLVETSSEVPSLPSRTLQPNLYKPYRFPGILIGECHRIQDTIRAYESLNHLGYEVVAVILEDHGVKDFVSSPYFTDKKVPLFEVPVFDPSELIDWFVKSAGVFEALKSTMILSYSSSFLNRHKRNKPLTVTNLTNTEWCEKKLENDLCRGSETDNESMRGGRLHHFMFDKQDKKFGYLGLSYRQYSTEPAGMLVDSEESKWALTFCCTIKALNSILKNPDVNNPVVVTEVYILGYVEGQWISGQIDHLEMSSDSKRIKLLDLKTRFKSYVPHEDQQRNGRFQLMLYKLLWDTLVEKRFPKNKFYKHFSVDPHRPLLKRVIHTLSENGIFAETFGGVVSAYDKAFKSLPPADDILTLRYVRRCDSDEASAKTTPLPSNKDPANLIKDCSFSHDTPWVRMTLKKCLQIWRAKRKAKYTPNRWKCNNCGYKKHCPGSRL